MTVTDGPYGPLIETKLRVLSWNLWWRFGPWEARRPAIAATLARIDADVIGLQEVWEDDEGGFAAELADGLGFHHVFASRFDLDGVRFGNAVLSRWPITGHEWRPLPAPPGQEEMRTVLRADIDGPRGPLQLYTTHLNWRFDQSHIRIDQVRSICEMIAEGRAARSYPPILCGDFNADPDSDEIRMLNGRAPVPVDKLVFHDAWEVDGRREMTWSNDNPYAALDLEPDRCLDYIFVGWPKAGGAGHILSCDLEGVEPVDGVVPSDHYAVLAELRY
jgi:endonuclease/exonuclease/phosphatase family metal-dependent hydrolase